MCSGACPLPHPLVALCPSLSLASATLQTWTARTLLSLLKRGGGQRAKRVSAAKSAKTVHFRHLLRISATRKSACTLLNFASFLASPRSLPLLVCTASLLGAPACYYTGTLCHQAHPALTTKEEGDDGRDGGKARGGGEARGLLVPWQVCRKVPPTFTT